MLRCDRCGREKEDVEVFAAKAKLRSREAEDRLRDHLQGIRGTQIGGFPKLCAECQAVLRPMGLAELSVVKDTKIGFGLDAVGHVLKDKALSVLHLPAIVFLGGGPDRGLQERPRRSPIHRLHRSRRFRLAAARTAAWRAGGRRGSCRDHSWDCCRRSLAQSRCRHGRYVLLRREGAVLLAAVASRRGQS